jgi:hypothetical protein
MHFKMYYAKRIVCDLGKISRGFQQCILLWLAGTVITIFALMKL